MWISIARLACACIFLLVSSTKVTAELDLKSESQGITLDDALTYALERNPDLTAFGYQLETHKGRIQQAGLAPNPELTVAVEDALGTDSYQKFGRAETTISLAWVFERGVRDYRVAAAKANASLSADDAEILRVDVAAETARRFLTVMANQGLAVTAGEAVRLAEETVQAVQHRVDAGSAPQADLARAEAELAKSKLSQEGIEYQYRSARYRLAAQWGDTKPSFSQVLGDPLVLPNAEPFASLQKQVEQNPEMARYLSKQRVDEAQLRLAQAQRKPPWEARVGVRRFEFTNDHALIASFTIPLAVRNRNQGRIAAASANIEHTLADRTATRVRIDTTLFVLYQELQNSLHQADTLRNEIIPRIESALTETRTAYEIGRYSYFEWSVVQGELLASRFALLEASIEAHRNIIEIERLTGVRAARPGTSP